MENRAGMPKGGLLMPTGKRESSDEGSMERAATTERAIERAREREEDSLATLQKSAARIQHAMNNPLAALLAEEQLLAMEPSLTQDQRETVERMIELTRRVIMLVRDLDELRGPVPPR
jgi:signal transduction histidine kinase